MLKKGIRERKEYLFKKEQELKNKITFEKKQKLKAALKGISIQ